MLIERDQVIAGFPAVTLRELMQELMHCSMSAGELADRIATLKLVSSDVTQLEASGLIEIAERGASGRIAVRDDEDWRDTTLYTTTIAGNALAKARIGKPMKRAKAAPLLDALLERVRAENDDPDSLFWIESVATFGSYNDEAKDMVGDIDVHLVYRHRYDADEHQRRNQALVDAAHADGRTGPTSYFAHLTWSEDQLFKRLRARQSRLDIQFDGVGDGHLLPPGATTRVVFTRDANS